MLQFKPFQTSGVWEFLDPDTQYKHVGATREELIRNIVNYRSNNQLDPIERLDLVVEHYICSLPQNCGKCEEKKLSRGLMQYIKGGVSLIQNMYYKSFVSVDEAERRASLCKTCTCNHFPDKDLFMAWSDEIALHSVGDRVVSDSHLLGNCLGCSCVLKAKVHYGGDIELEKEEEVLIRACNKKCWQLKENKVS
jgi:hypothetical protein